MGRSRSGFRRVSVWASLVLLSSVVGLTACGTVAAPTPAIVTAKNADVGAAITSAGGLQVTLAALPEKVEVITGAGASWLGEDRKWGEKRIPEGTWLIVPVKLTNTSSKADMLPSGKTFIVRDAQGRESPITGRPEHMMKVYSDERWGTQDNYLVNNPMNAGVTREGPLIFDVAIDATGLTLTSEGATESIGLGF